MPKAQEWTEGALKPVITEEQSWSCANLETVLTEAIYDCLEDCLQADCLNVATTLSGGLDSTFCLSKLKESTMPITNIHTFTIGYGKDHQDIIHARIAAKTFNAIHTEIIPTQKAKAWAKKKLARLTPVEEVSLGDIAVFLAYKAIADHGFKTCIAHDGIDELLGGYWGHRSGRTKSEKKAAFQHFWAELIPKHIVPLEKSARFFGIKVLYPYLQPEVVEFISHIPVNERTNKKTSKIPLRRIASKHLPPEIIGRSKLGFCSALD